MERDISYYWVAEIYKKKQKNLFSQSNNTERTAFPAYILHPNICIKRYLKTKLCTKKHNQFQIDLYENKTCGQKIF